MSNDHPFKDDREARFNYDVKVNAHIQHEKTANADAKQSNSELRKIGERLNPTAHHSLKDSGFKYVGSCAVHAYVTEIVGEVVFISQVDTLHGCPEYIASKAFEALRKDVMESYGHKRQETRSGF